MRPAFLSAALFLSVAPLLADNAVPALPKPGAVVIDELRGEVILSAKIQIPDGKPCINEYGERIQAFAGCATAAGGDAKMAGYFVFLVDVPTEDVHAALIKLGCKPRVHYSIQQGKQHQGLKPTTTPTDYLQGDPVALSVFWQKDGRWVEKPYQDFVTERVVVDGKPVEKPWTPHFVFHGSGALHKSGTGCLACPCDCAGGIIADNRNPLYEPKPMVKFDTSKVPPAGTQVYVRIRPTITKE
ncbi:YdjY domain-containing protein [Fimbriiglobus ruber]|uniref:Uncharacterized protein n=1 Tax=Fimbriiglobus ruber TaxID=1908690 RepID=A0A225DDU4_9BACT|nr:YdjY domain-containing protein [Fimbriiglobus ruber]OWK39721.1 hypothetical protein FRUB_05611 [Fimbriiglobus ruber]